MGILDNFEAYLELDTTWEDSDLELIKQNPHINQE
jgi:hypothetical protein